MGDLVELHSNGFAISRDLIAILIPLPSCKPLGRETRKHPPGQIRKLATSLNQYGFVLPILIDAQDRVVAGWGLILAARQLGLSEVPAIRLTDVPEAKLRALRLALNRITEDAAWDRDALVLEFTEILELEPQIDLQESGFEMGEIDCLLDDHGIGQEDDLPEIPDETAPVTRSGDHWQLGPHSILCDDALSAESYNQIMGAEKANMVFTDPPYNVPATQNLRARGRQAHQFRNGLG